MRFLAFTRKLALLTPALAGCGSAPPPPPPTVSPPAPTTTATTTAETTSEPVTSGPCRCSWDNNAAAANRVCKKGETNYEGQACVAASHPKYNGPVKGPLPPPDLPVT
jgi:hypothetical protein